MGSHFSKKDVFSGSPVVLGNVSTEGVFSDEPVERGNDENSLIMLLRVKQFSVFDIENQLINTQQHFRYIKKEDLFAEIAYLGSVLHSTRVECDQLVAQLRNLGVNVVNPPHCSAVQTPVCLINQTHTLYKKTDTKNTQYITVYVYSLFFLDFNGKLAIFKCPCNDPFQQH
jgi:hypothetical protein